MQLVLHHTKRIGGTIFSFLIKRWYIAIILLTVVGYMYYRYQTASAYAKEKTYTVTRETLQDILALSGEIDASEKASLHFQSGGRLSWVGVKEGDTVKKFQGIASLDQRQLEKSLQKYLNTFSKERNDFDQSDDDNDSLVIDMSEDIRNAAKRTLQNSQQDLNNTVIDVELQTIAKEYSYLSSPIDGVVTRVDAPNAGVNISLTDTYEIVNPDTLYFAIAADQTEVVKLTEGMKGKITFDAFPDNPVDGAISSIAFTPVAEETGAVYKSKMQFSPGSKSGYRLGMTGDVEFILKEIENTVAVPLEYIVDEEDKQYVWKKENGTKKKVPVKIGEEYEGMVQVTDGLFAGDEIYEVTK